MSSVPRRPEAGTTEGQGGCNRVGQDHQDDKEMNRAWPQRLESAGEGVGPESAVITVDLCGMLDENRTSYLLIKHLLCSQHGYGIFY